MILTADWHLTDKPEDEYRWAVFDRLIECARKFPGHRIAILGDITDRKDRHSARLTNRVLSGLVRLAGVGSGGVTILKGNHDDPISGPAYWSLLNHVPGVQFIDEVTLDERKWLWLPYVPDPSLEWQGLNLDGIKCVFLHQLVTGVNSHGRVLENPKMPPLPRKATIYAGDIHTHQKVGPVQYVGAPHPINYGDDYETRFLIIDDAVPSKFSVYTFEAMQKMTLNIRTPADLERVKNIRPGDQVKVRVELDPDTLDTWPGAEAQIRATLDARQVSVALVEPTIALPDRGSADADTDLSLQRPPDTLRQFAAVENLPAALINAGLNYLSE